MPIGTPVRAAAQGTIISIRSDWKLIPQSSGVEGNYISIRHDDGLVTTYKHLKSGGILVRIGQRVLARELIGYSGNTGFVTGPHLHFEVTIRECDGGVRSVPFAFFDEKNATIEPETGMELTGI